MLETKRLHLLRGRTDKRDTVFFTALNELGILTEETVPGMNGIAEKGGMIVLLYLTMIPSLGMALGVGQCANPNGSIGISRALTAMLAYDIPFVIVIFMAIHFCRVRKDGGISGPL